MLFCPKCKYEYEDDIKICPDCGSELVAELINTDEQFNNQIYFDENKEYLEQLKAFLIENGIENVSINLETDRNVYSLCTDTSSKFKATTLLNILFKEELEKEAENNDISTILSANMNLEKKSTTKQGKYKNALARYNDYFGTGVVNTIIGILGILGFIFDFYNISSDNSILPHIGMTSIFCFFSGSGLYYLVKSQKFKPEIAKEGKLTDEIVNYVLQNYDKSYIDDKLKQMSQDYDEDTIYFVRVAFLSNEIKNKFGEVNDEYIDNLIEQLYEKIFEE